MASDAGGTFRTVEFSFYRFHRLVKVGMMITRGQTSHALKDRPYKFCNSVLMGVKLRVINFFNELVESLIVDFSRNF